MSKWKISTLETFMNKNELSIQTGPFGTQLKASDYVESGTPVINVRNIGFGIMIDDNIEYITDETRDKLSSHILRKHDIVFGRKGAVERHAFVDEKHDGWFQGSDCIRVRIESPTLRQRYVSYCLLTPEHKRWMANNCSHGVTMASLNQDIVKRIEIPVPDLQVQDQVISVLATYDALIENNNRRIAILEEMAQKLYREWFVHFRFPGHEKVKMVESEMGLIPERWGVSTIYDEAYILGGGTPSKANPEFWQGGEIPLFSPRDATGQTYVENTGMNITELGLKKCNSGLYPRNTIVITARGTVGKIVLVAENMAINQSCYALQSKGISQFYLLHMLRSAVEELKKVATGTAFDAIITETFKNIKCLVPVKSVCLEFEHLLTNIYDAILVLQQKNTNLRKTRDLLLPRLISGDIDVSELDIPIKEG